MLPVQTNLQDLSYLTSSGYVSLVPMSKCHAELVKFISGRLKPCQLLKLDSARRMFTTSTCQCPYDCTRLLQQYHCCTSLHIRQVFGIPRTWPERGHLLEAIHAWEHDILYYTQNYYSILKYLIMYYNLLYYNIPKYTIIYP